MSIDSHARNEDARTSGQLGADEPSYGRSTGKKPDPTPKSGPNSEGPMYEQGGVYPGKRPESEAERRSR